MSNQLTPLCPYCHSFSKKVQGNAIYPHRPDLFHKTFYLCKPCDAYVGTHEGTDRPLGRLADPILREWKKTAHAHFDPIWKQYHREHPHLSKGKARNHCYKVLAELMGIKRDDCHIGMFDPDQCVEVFELCRSGLLEEEL